MTDISKFRDISPTAYADALERKQFMDIGIKEVWKPIPRIAGKAYTVKCYPGDNLMLHAAIYRAAPGAIIVVESGTLDYAMSGGNVCAIAQKRGIAGFVIDGVIRDIAEVRESNFPIFARGIMPKPGVKQTLGTLNESICCGGVEVHPGDIIVDWRHKACSSCGLALSRTTARGTRAQNAVVWPSGFLVYGCRRTAHDRMQHGQPARTRHEHRCRSKSNRK